MQLNEFLTHFENVQKHGDYFTCRCKGHEDNKNSLSVSLDTDKILIKCHAGCNTTDVVKAAGLKMSDLFLNPQKTESTERQVSAVYDYTDADGKLLFQCVRYIPKDFKQRRPDGNGGYAWNLKNITTVLYHLPEVLQAVKSGARIIVTEGEKDADNIRKWGYAATTSPLGAGKWRPGYTESLNGAREVILVAHKDGPGRKHIETIAGGLFDKVDTLKVIEMPDVPGFKVKDFTNWVEAGGTKEEFEKLLEAAPLFTIQTPVDTPEPKQQPHFPLTDMGNGERLVNRYGDVIRYIPERGRWLVWNGKYWQLDNVINASLMDKAKTVVRDIPKEANRGMTSKEFEDTLNWAKSSESEKRLNSMVSLARYEHGITVSITELDRDLFFFNVQNGTVDLKTGHLKPHDKKDLVTKISPATHTPGGAHSELWESTLNKIFKGDAELIGYLQKVTGYSATGDMTTPIIPFCYGTGANGKSTFLNTIAYLLADYAGTINADVLMVHKNTDGKSTNEQLADVNGKRAVFAREIQKNRRLNESEIKGMDGGEKMKVARKYEHDIEFKPSHKLWLAGNHKPIIRDTTDGTWRRLRLFPFTVTIPESEQDPDLRDKLQAPDELSGVLNWVIAGAVRWVKEGLKNVPDAVIEATLDYRKDQDAILPFLSDKCRYRAGAQVGKTELFEVYEAHCTENGKESVGKKAFNELLKERGGVHDRDRGTDGKHVWWGIELLATKNDKNDVNDVNSNNSPRKDNSIKSLVNNVINVINVIPDVQNDKTEFAESDNSGVKNDEKDAPSAQKELFNADNPAPTENNVVDDADPLPPEVFESSMTCNKCHKNTWWVDANGFSVCNHCHPKDGEF